MKSGWLWSGLLLMWLLWLQHTLWFAPGGLVERRTLEQQLLQQRDLNRQLHTRNAALAAEVQDLKQGLNAVEERARLELGMLKTGEVFYQVLE